MNMKSNGIYGYWDVLKKQMVYVGQSKDIIKRNKDHYDKLRYNEQQINRIIQNNFNRYKLIIIKTGDFSEYDRNILESHYIWFYNTFNDLNKFNYTKGGDNHSFVMPESAKNKISKALLGKSKPKKTISKMYGNKNKKPIPVSTKSMFHFIEIRRYRDRGRFIYFYCENGLSSHILKKSFDYDKVLKWAIDNNKKLTKINK